MHSKHVTGLCSSRGVSSAIGKEKGQSGVGECGCTVWANSALVMYVVVTVASKCYGRSALKEGQ